MDTETIDTGTDLLEEILSKRREPAEPVDEDKDEKDPTKLKQRKPPTNGMCRRCGQNKPINRLMLCYPCWVKTVLEEKAGWREGMPHPDNCDCQGLTDHVRKSDGN